jgi:hypothetical protein
MVFGPWRGAALERKRRTRIFVSAHAWPEIALNRRLPGTSQRGFCLLARHADEPFTDRTMGKTPRAVISGSRLFNAVFGLPRDGENIARSLGTFQSGSPPGLRDCGWSRNERAPVFQQPARLDTGDG